MATPQSKLFTYTVEEYLALERQQGLEQQTSLAICIVT